MYIVAGEANRMSALNLSGVDGLVGTDLSQVYQFYRSTTAGSPGADHKGDVWPN